MNVVDLLRAKLSDLPGVIQRPSRFGSRTNEAWTVAGKEFAHLHSATMLDLRLPRLIQKSLRDDPKAHFRKSPSDWIELEFHTAKDVEEITSLARRAWTGAKNITRS